MKKNPVLDRILCAVLTLALCLLPVLSLGEEAGTAAADYEPMYQLAEPYGFRLGGCFSYYDLKQPAYLDLMAAHFNSLTCTNETKAYSLLNQAISKANDDGMPGMNYVQADKMIAWAQEHGIRVRGHVLVWDAYMTPWFFHEGYDEFRPLADRETMRKRLESYIDQVVTHFEEKFPGVVYCWDVVNEAIGDSDAECLTGDARRLRTTRGGQPNQFLESVGEDYVEYSFLCARNTVEKLGADIRLFYNDYNLFQKQKRTAAIELAGSINRYAQDDNGKFRRLIDGVGMQGYLGGYGVQAGCLEDSLIRDMKESIALYAENGLEVQVTEMAVRNYEKDKAPEHAAFYARLFREAFMTANSGENKPLTAVCIWGLLDCPQLPRDNYSWKLNSPYGGLFTEKFQVKTSFDAVWHALKGE